MKRPPEPLSCLLTEVNKRLKVKVIARADHSSYS